MDDAEHLTHELQILCRRYHALLLNMDEQTLSVAVSGAPSADMLAALRFAGNRQILLEQWPQARMEQQLNPVKTVAEPTEDYHAEPEDHINDEDTPAVHFINQTLRLAIQRRASDIHLEPLLTQYRVRLRIDGVLQEISPPPAELSTRITARLKIMGKLNIAERRLPQDGQFSLTLDQQVYSLRIATLPVQHGEKVVLRVQQTQQQELALAKLGLSDGDLARLIRVLGMPQGMILVTGPTGSGKTVTLYSAIRWLNDVSRNICSVEDPIEIPLPGINQTAINPKADLDFSRILRAMLRQDPDVIMVGEIRDAETAEIAVKAAQTGHLVMSTLHTNSAVETLTRLSHLGIPGYLIAAALKLVISQRLVRRLCPHCKTPAEPLSQLPAELWRGPLRHWQAKGCSHCLSGYYDRIAIYEFLVITPALQQALADNANNNRLARLARESGSITLLAAGLALVNQGVTSITEIYRIAGAGVLDQGAA
ncbi:MULTISPECIES: type II secretion system protein GspE [unclassified Brenneria]|uniref:type II secretion system protein GspE n=1 Tax=unclassified Brenneria TaxID=2634434 RepID=UPI0029C14A80|nr:MULTISPECIES: type II secretion system protein GspE [unclassified Brenneria]MDX5628910.1 type II secretion system protein GspE [Brenneria sp. L3-3Z]MDX5696049.1 type II secretion system protein GspE [Brenneria sp. L4-2C]MEE3661102.1 type II secretion system protein GspE [Brenneria sp. g21c3]